MVEHYGHQKFAKFLLKLSSLRIRELTCVSAIERLSSQSPPNGSNGPKPLDISRKPRFGDGHGCSKTIEEGLPIAR